MGSLSEPKVCEPPRSGQQNPLIEPFQSFASHALRLGVNYSFDGTEPDGHWVGELKYDSIEQAQNGQHQ